MHSPLYWISASILEASLLYPLDVAITRQQTSPIYVPRHSAGHIISRLYRTGTLYNGFLPHIASSFTALSIRYSFASSFDVQRHSVIECTLAGLALGAAEGAILTPFEALKIPQQISDCKLPIDEAFKAVTQNRTYYRNLLRGLLPTVSKHSIYGATTFTSVKFFEDFRDRDFASGTGLLAIVSLSSITAAILGNPIDVVKARSQSLLKFPPITKHRMFDGLHLKLWRITLGTCIVLTIYDELTC